MVDHEATNCRSHVMYKGALQGQDAHAVWIGDVLIQAAATGTDTYELNRNLVLTDGARVDSVPNLEIETGETVCAGHASATGRFDDEQLFYLMARGIPADEARRLVVRGFFAELVQQIGLPDVEERAIAERPPLVTAMKWCGCDADFTASAAMRTLPSVPFLKPTGHDSPDASSRWIWLSVVRAPIAAHAIRSAMYCGVVMSRNSVPAGRPRLFTPTARCAPASGPC